jgi:hypothetical protein
MNVHNLLVNHRAPAAALRSAAPAKAIDRPARAIRKALDAAGRDPGTSPPPNIPSRRCCRPTSPDGDACIHTFLPL